MALLIIIASIIFLGIAFNAKAKGTPNTSKDMTLIQMSRNPYAPSSREMARAILAFGEAAVKTGFSAEDFVPENKVYSAPVVKEAPVMVAGLGDFQAVKAVKVIEALPVKLTAPGVWGTCKGCGGNKKTDEKCLYCGNHLND